MKKIILGILITASLTACHDSFLKEYSYSQIAIENSFKTAEDAVMSVNAAYSLLASDDYYDRTYITMSDVSTDMLRSEWVNDLDTYGSLSNTNKEVKAFWGMAWKVNAQTNLVMEKVPGINMDVNLQQRVLGEASFIRALNYFHLVRFFGNIPLVLKTTTNTEEMFVKQVSSDSVYTQIIKDLDFAIQNLPATYEANDLGRATSWAAKSLLAKVYLTMAGMRADPATGELIQGDAKYYEKTVELCQEIIDSGQYDLFANYADVFDNDKENTVEDIFSIQYQEGTGGYDGGVGTSKCPAFVPKGSGLAAVEWKVYAAEKGFYDQFEDRDKRKKVIFLTSYVAKDGSVDEMPSSILPYPFVRKYLSDLHEGTDKQYSAVDGKDYGDNYPVIRYADILLMHSEALNEIEGPTEKSLYGVNEVRKRAGLPPLSVNCSDGELRVQILDERCKELCYEGHGWFDYVRHGVLIERMVMSGSALGISQRNYLMPIPFSAIQVNKNLVQNYGY